MWVKQLRDYQNCLRKINGSFDWISCQEYRLSGRTNSKYILLDTDNKQCDVGQCEGEVRAG